MSFSGRRCPVAVALLILISVPSLPVVGLGGPPKVVDPPLKWRVVVRVRVASLLCLPFVGFKFQAVWWSSDTAALRVLSGACSVYTPFGSFGVSWFCVVNPCTWQVGYIGMRVGEASNPGPPKRPGKTDPKSLTSPFPAEVSPLKAARKLTRAQQEFDEFLNESTLPESHCHPKQRSLLYPHNRAALV